MGNSSEVSVRYPEKGDEVPLDSNENLLLEDEYYRDISEEIKEYEKLNVYPSPTGKELREELADLHGLKAEQITVGNGSDAILDTLYRTLVPKDGTIAHFLPSYEMYDFFASRNERTTLEVPLRPDFTPPEKTSFLNDVDCLLICSPNNPTGLTVDEGYIKRVLESDTSVIIDQAYAEFSQQSIKDLLSEYSNLVLVRTFSKAWGLAGIRVGYSMSSPETNIRLQEKMLPYNVNSLSLSIAVEAVKRKDMVYRAVEETVEQREFLRGKLETLGFNTLPSEANFVFCKPPKGFRPEEIEEHLLKNGIRIRTFDKERLKDHVRITVGNEEINQRLLGLLEELIL